MGSVTYDWSPLFQAIQGASQRSRYNDAISAMMGGQSQAGVPQQPQQNPTALPTPAMTVNPGSIGGMQLPTQNIPSQPAPAPAPQMATPQAASNPYASMLPMLKFMDPSMGMPLLMQMQMKKAEHDQQVQDKQVRQLSPEELQTAGYRKGSVVFRDQFGADHISQQSDLHSPEAMQQDLQEKIDEATKVPMTQAQQAQHGLSQMTANAAMMNARTNQAELGEKQREYNASNPMLAGGGGAGPAPLESYPPAVKNTVQSMLDGRMQPPSSFALSKPYWQNMMALANSTDPTFDQTQWGARASARKDMAGGGKSYQLLNSGNTAIQHLGRLYDQIPDVAGHQFPVVGNLLNSGQNMLAQSSGIPGVDAYNDTLGHLSEETTKFYRGTGGNEADVERNMANLAPNKSTEVKQAGVGNTVHLVFGALQPKVEQYNKTMGTNYPVSHFLSSTSVKTLQRMGYDPDTGEKTGQAGGAGWSIKLVK